MKKIFSWSPHLWFALALIAFCCSEDPSAERYVPSPNYWKYSGDKLILTKVIADLQKDPNVTQFQSNLSGQPLWAESKSLLLDGTPTILIPVVNAKGDGIKAVITVRYKGKGKEKQLEYQTVFRKNLQKKEGEYQYMTRAAWRGYFKTLDRSILNKKNNSPGFSTKLIPEAERQNISSRTADMQCGWFESEECWLIVTCVNGECEDAYETCEITQTWDCWWVDDPCSDECDSSCSNYTGDPCRCNGDCGGGDEPCYDNCNPACANYDGCGTAPDQFINLVDDPCLSHMVENFKNHSYFINYMFNTEDFDMIYRDEDLGAGIAHDWATTNKQTNPLTGYLSITTTLNSRTLPGASLEYIAATLIHEMFHGYQDIFDTPNSSNEASHIVMSQPAEIQSMTEMLLLLYPALDPQDASDLTWGGLEGTPAFNALDPAVRTRINSVNRDHKRGAHGTRCP